jgi:hypothetical protein
MSRTGTQIPRREGRNCGIDTAGATLEEPPTSYFVFTFQEPTHWGVGSSNKRVVKLKSQIGDHDLRIWVERMHRISLAFCVYYLS